MGCFSLSEKRDRPKAKRILRPPPPLATSKIYGPPRRYAINDFQITPINLTTNIISTFMGSMYLIRRRIIKMEVKG